MSFLTGIVFHSGHLCCNYIPGSPHESEASLAVINMFYVIICSHNDAAQLEAHLFIWLYCFGSSKYGVSNTLIAHRHNISHRNKINEECLYKTWHTLSVLCKQIIWDSCFRAESLKFYGNKKYKLPMLIMCFTRSRRHEESLQRTSYTLYIINFHR